MNAAGLGEAWHCKARLGEARHGAAWQGEVLLVLLRYMARPCEAGRGLARLGVARQGAVLIRSLIETKEAT